MQGNSMDKQNPEVKPRRKRKRFTVSFVKVKSNHSAGAKGAHLKQKNIV